MRTSWPFVVVGAVVVVLALVLLWKRATVVPRLEAHEEWARERFSRGESLQAVPLVFSTRTRFWIVTTVLLLFGGALVVRGFR